MASVKILTWLVPLLAFASTISSQALPDDKCVCVGKTEQSTDVNGLISGQYSYVDPLGVTVTVVYTVDKFGKYNEDRTYVGSYGIASAKAVSYEIVGQFWPEISVIVKETLREYQDMETSVVVDKIIVDLNEILMEIVERSRIKLEHVEDLEAPEDIIEGLRTNLGAILFRVISVQRGEAVKFPGPTDAEFLEEIQDNDLTGQIVLRLGAPLEAVVREVYLVFRANILHSQKPIASQVVTKVEKDTMHKIEENTDKNSEILVQQIVNQIKPAIVTIVKEEVASTEIKDAVDNKPKKKLVKIVAKPKPKPVKVEAQPVVDVMVDQVSQEIAQFEQVTSNEAFVVHILNQLDLEIYSVVERVILEFQNPAYTITLEENEIYKKVYAELQGIIRVTVHTALAQNNIVVSPEIEDSEQYQQFYIMISDHVKSVVVLKIKEYRVEQQVLSEEFINAVYADMEEDIHKITIDQIHMHGIENEELLTSNINLKLKAILPAAIEMAIQSQNIEVTETFYQSTAYIKLWDAVLEKIDFNLLVVIEEYKVEFADKEAFVTGIYSELYQEVETLTTTYMASTNVVSEVVQMVINKLDTKIVDLVAEKYTLQSFTQEQIVAEIKLGLAQYITVFIEKIQENTEIEEQVIAQLTQGIEKVIEEMAIANVKELHPTGATEESIIMVIKEKLETRFMRAMRSMASRHQYLRDPEVQSRIITKVLVQLQSMIQKYVSQQILIITSTVTTKKVITKTVPVASVPVVQKTTLTKIFGEGGAHNVHVETPHYKYSYSTI